eukprot:TRINITY_DN11822_c0_g1_i1.p1 TRINITY_DN11822_c0_g1~~TRINITY_DN11822_c0_g1_i1.p1  ORF type:complete len:671 (-),score=147.97 TRINITY_DN11822_c0_g1_i1:220-2232(-)
MFDDSSEDGQSFFGNFFRMEETLVYFCEQNDLLKAKNALKNDYSINLSDGIGLNTPLTASCHYGSLDLVEWCLQQGADIELVGGGKTPLEHAVQCNKTDIVDFLLSKGAKVSALAIITAATSNSIENLSKLFEYGAQINSIETVESPVIPDIIALGTSSEVITLLVEKGANVNAYKESQIPALLRAVQLNRIDIVSTLLELGADPNIRCVIKIQFQEESGVSYPLYEAFKYGNVQLVNTLLEAGADIHLETETKVFEYSCVHAAASRDYGEMEPLIELLVELGVSLDSFCEQFETNPAIINLANRPDAVKLFIKHGAELNYTAAILQHQTLVEKLASLDHFDCVRLALENGASAEKSGLYSVLYYLMQKKVGDMDLISLVLDCGGSVNEIHDGESIKFEMARNINDHGLLLSYFQNTDNHVFDKNNRHLYEYIYSLHMDLIDILYEPTGECGICGEDVEFYFLFGCRHKFCQECVASWVQAQLGNFRISFNCPDRSCDFSMNHQDIINNAGKYKDMYMEKSNELYISMQSDFIWCPSDDCIDGGICTEPSATCNTCGIVFCTSCKGSTHEGWTCEEASQLTGLDEDEAVDFWKNKFSKRCLSCLSYIEKNGGCSHITCQFCRYEFCWLCGRRYLSGNYVFTETCNCAANPHPEDEYYHKIKEIWGPEYGD